MRIDEQVLQEVCQFAYATAKWLSEDKPSFDHFAAFMYAQHEGAPQYNTLTADEQISLHEDQIRGLASALHCADAIRHLILFDQPTQVPAFMMPPMRLNIQTEPDAEDTP